MTRYFLTSMRDPALDKHLLEIECRRFDEGGGLISSSIHELGKGGITVVDLPETTKEQCGYCWLLQRDSVKTIPLQFHFSIMSTVCFAKTHGRAKGIPIFFSNNLVDKLIRALDPYPYAAQTALTRQSDAIVGFLFLNVSNRQCRIVRTWDGIHVTSLPPHGTRLVFDATPDLPSVEFAASAPFTFYVAMRGPSGRGLTLQHIKEGSF